MNRLRFNQDLKKSNAF